MPETVLDAFRNNDPPIPFIGSGFGREAAPPLMTGGELCKELRCQLGVPDESEHLEVLLQYLKNDHVGSDRVVHDWLEHHLGHNGVAKRPDPGGAHHLLLQLPIREALTTNYDSLFSQAAKLHPHLALLEVYTPADYQSAVRCLAPSTIVSGRLHGSFENREQIVATSDDYIRNFFRQEWRDLIAGFVKDRKLLFIGYSLRDFTSWTSYVTALIEGRRSAWPHTMVSPAQSRHERAYWKEYGIQFVPLTAGQFLIGLHEALGTLESGDNAIFAAAVCLKTSVGDAKVKLEQYRKEWRYKELRQAALRCVQEFGQNE